MQTVPTGTRSGRLCETTRALLSSGSGRDGPVCAGHAGMAIDGRVVARGAAPESEVQLVMRLCVAASRPPPSWLQFGLHHRVPGYTAVASSFTRFGSRVRSSTPFVSPESAEGRCTIRPVFEKG